MADLKAPTGKFRVIAVDKFEGPLADYLVADVSTMTHAQELAKRHRRSNPTDPTYVYDDRGKMVFEA